VFNSNTLAEKQLTDVVNNKNTLKLSFGQLHKQDEDSKHWDKPSTNTDLIDFMSIFRLTYGWPVDPYASGRVESRFLDTSDPEKTRTLNPTTFTESVGVAHVFIKEESRELTARLGGAVRQHLDRDALPEGETERENVLTDDAGLEFVTGFRTPLADGAITLTCRALTTGSRWTSTGRTLSPRRSPVSSSLISTFRYCTTRKSTRT
jgi:hypothetical protein